MLVWNRPRADMTMTYVVKAKLLRSVPIPIDKTTRQQLAVE
jgi:hypothetical protein